MSKTEIWRNAARTATEQQRQAVKSTAEARRQLTESLELIAESLKLLSDENRETLKKLQNQFQDTAELARQQIEKQVDRVRSAANIATKTAETARAATERLQQAAKPMTWQLIVLVFLIGLLTGVILLTALAIWQPKLLVGAWQAAQAFGTVPVQ